ncbi:hypothetical protein ACEPAF_7356 [Sanghuangporus sanghuang]
MADDHEVLDWGADDDEHFGEGAAHTAATGDIDDVVSLGGEEADLQEKAAFQSRTMQENGDEGIEDATPKLSPPPTVDSVAKRSPPRESNEVRAATAPTVLPLAKAASVEASDVSKASQRRSNSPPRQMKTPMTHALPPKPVVTPIPPPRNSSFIQASAMSEHRRDSEKDRDDGRRRANGAKQSDSDVLPPDWEVRRSSSGEIYYYNKRTFVSQWECPSVDGKASSPRQRDINRDEIPDRSTDSKIYETRSSDDLRSDRLRDSHKGNDRSSGQFLSYDDRHYRPSGGPETSSFRPHRRERRGHSPVPSEVRSPSRNEAPKDTLPQHGKDGTAKELPRSSGQRTENEVTQSRRRQPSPELPDTLSMRRSDVRDGAVGQDIRESGHDRGFDQETRWNVGRAQEEKTQEIRAASGDSGSALYTPREAAPRPGGVAILSTQRRNRSRSPPLSSRNSTSLRGTNEAARKYEHSVPASYERPPTNSRPTGPVLEPSLSSQSSHWNRTPSGYPDRGSPMDMDLPVRRPRENEPVTANIGLDAKRRRVESVTADSAHARRGRSRSPIDGRRNIIRRDSYTGGNEDRSQPHRNVNGRQSYIFRAILLYLTGPYDFPTRDEGWSSKRPAFADITDRNRTAGSEKLGNVAANRWPSGADPMDVDRPRIGVAGIASATGSMYSDRMAGVSGRRGVIDRPSTSNARPSSNAFVPPPVRNDRPASVVTPAVTGRPHQGSQEPADNERIYRSSNERWTERPSGPDPERRILTDDRMPQERTDIPTGPRVYRRSPPLIAPSPKLTGANNVPVPPKKGWAVDTGSEVQNSIQESQQSTSSSERTRQPEVDSKSLATVSPETRDRSLHGDVERRMSLNDRNEKTDNESKISVSTHDPGQSDAPHTESQNSHRHGQRASRFSKPDERPTPVNENSEPRIWLPREDAESMRRNVATLDSSRARSPSHTPGGARSSAISWNGGHSRDRPRADRWPRDYEESREPIRRGAEANSLVDPPNKHTREQHTTTTTVSRDLPGESASTDSSAKVNTIGAVHPSRLTNVAAAVTPGRYGRSQTARVDDELLGDGHGQLRPNSLLERLGMNKDADARNASQNVSLRERVHTPGSKDDDPIHNTVNLEGGSALEIEHYGDGQKGRVPGRRNRGGRGRRKPRIDS